MKLSKKIGNTANIIILAGVLIVLVIIGILMREQMKNKWLSRALFGEKKIQLREDFNTQDKYRVNTGVYAIKYYSDSHTKLLKPNHNNNNAEFSSANDTTSYNIDNTIYYSKPKDKWYSYKTGIEYRWSYLKLGMSGHIKVESGAGTGRHWFVSFKNNGHNIQGEGAIGSRGLNMIYIPPFGGGAIKRKAFDALGSGGFVSQIDKFIHLDMPNGSIFLLAVLDEAGQQNYRNYYNRLGNEISAHEFRMLSWRASYAYIGIKISMKNHERVDEARAPDGAAKAADTSVETRLKPYYIYPSRAGLNPLRQGPIVHRSVDYVSVPNNSYSFHNIPDGMYTITGKKYDILVAQISGTIQQYNIYKIHGNNGDRKINREPNGPYTMIGKRYGSGGNYHYNVNIFKSNGHDYAFNTVLRSYKNDQNISYDYINNGNPKRTRHNFMIQDNDNKYLGFGPTFNSQLKVYSNPDSDTLLKNRSEHFIAKVLKYENDNRHAIIFFTAKKILYVKPDGSLGYEDITDNDTIKHLRTHNNISHHAQFNNNKYKFSFMPTPLETVTGGSSQQRTDGSMIITHLTVASPTTDVNYTGKMTYKYLSSNRDSLSLQSSTTFKTPTINDALKFKLIEITDPDDKENLDCTLVNYYRTSTEDSVDYVHMRNSNDNPDGETNCRFINLYNAHLNEKTPNGENCSAYRPRYVQSINGKLRIPNDDYSYLSDRKIGPSSTPLNVFNDKSLKQCMQQCRADDRCYVFTFKDHLTNNPVTLNECKTYGPGDAANKVDDMDHDYYKLKKDAEIRQLNERPVPVREWTADEKAYTSSPCWGSTNIESCSTMSDTCRFARGKCNMLCENTSSGCTNNKIETIGSVSDFNITLALELIGTSQVKATISKVEPTDITNNFSYPIIKSDGIVVEFIKSGQTEFSSERSDNKKITVNYVIDYTGTNDQYYFINDGDAFNIDIPPMLCTTSNCDELRNHSIKIKFTDIYGRTKSFAQMLPDVVVSQATQTHTTIPHDSKALQQARANQHQIGQHLGQ